MKRLGVALIAISCTLGWHGRPVSGATAPGDYFDVISVADGVFATIGGGLGGLAVSNGGFVIGDSSVLVIDTFYTPAAAEKLIAEIAARTPLPIKWAINTHYHLDHTGGNQVFAARNIPIIAQDKTREWVETRNSRSFSIETLRKRRTETEKRLAETAADQTEQKSQLQGQLRQIDAMMVIRLTPASVSYDSGTLRVWLGKREVVLFSLPGHTGGDTMAFVPDANVLFMGDMGWSKGLPNLVDATVNDWIPSLDRILSQYGNATFVPGHGPVCKAAEIRAFQDYLADLRSRVKQAIADGLTIDQAKEKLQIPERFKDFNYQFFTTPNVSDMYKELKGTKAAN
jgi:cyclase